MAGTANDCRLKFKSWNGLKEGVQVDRAIVKPYNKLTHRHLSSKTTAWCGGTGAGRHSERQGI